MNSKAGKRIISLALTAVMVFTVLLGVSVYAEDSGDLVLRSVITAFDAPSEDMAFQTVPFGTPIDELALPDTLGAEVDSIPNSVPVNEWESEPEYDGDAAGIYILAPVISDEYTIYESVSLPFITVTVEESGIAVQTAQTVTITIAEDENESTALYLTEGVPLTEQDLLAGVSAEDENGSPITVTIEDAGGLNMENPAIPEGPVFPATPYIITYEAAHPITGEIFTKTREAYVTAGAIMPLASVPGNYSFDISEGNITVENGSSSGLLKVTYGSPQTTTGDIADTQPITITGTGTTTAYTVTVKGGVTANITLEDADIDVSGTDNACAFDITENSAVNLTLSGTNTLKSDDDRAGLEVEAGNTLNITAASTGTLTSTGGHGGAGIGGCYSSSGSGGNGGTITISGGTVTANSSGGGAGIGGGGGYNGSGGTITISGGTVTANSGGGNSGAGIGDGYSDYGGNTTITGGSVKSTRVDPWPKNGSGNSVYLNTLTVGSSPVINKAVTAASVGGLSYTYGINDVVTDSDGKVYFWLPQSAGSAYPFFVVADNNLYYAEYERKNATETQTLIRRSLADGNIVITQYSNYYEVEIAGSSLGSYGYNTPFPISGSGTPPTNTVKVTADGSYTSGSDPAVQLTLSGVNIDVSAQSGICAFEITGNSAVDLTLSGVSSLKSGENRAGLEVATGNTLTITAASTGTLTATGSGTYWEGGASIGGGNNSDGGTINISGGTVIATVCGGAGIGGGSNGNGGTINISGGTVTAAGSSGAGIGGGYDGDGGTINISGGTVTATGALGNGGADIGNGYYGTGVTVTITGGSVNPTTGRVSSQPRVSHPSGALVYLNTLTVGGSPVTNAVVTAVNADGLSTYGIKDVFTDSNGKVYFWLPQNSGTNAAVTVTADSKIYGKTYVRDNNPQTHTLLISAPDVTFPTASAITYGLTLADSTLTGGTSGRGTFAWADDTVIPALGNNSYTVVFTPSDMASYYYPGISGWDGATQTVRRTVSVTSAPPDTTAPAVASVSPGGTGVSVNGNIVITFNEKMDTAAGTVSLNGTQLTGAGAWSARTNPNDTYTIAYSGLLYNTSYTIAVAGFKDTAGNVMVADSAHSFRTTSGGSGGGSGGGGGSSGNSYTPQTPAYKMVTIKDQSGRTIGSFDTTGSISGGVMSIKPNSQSDSYVFSFNLLRLFELERANKGGKFVITLPGMEYNLPFNMANIITGLADFLGDVNLQDYTLDFTINKLTGDDLTKAQEAFKKAYPNGEVSGDFYDINFTLYKNSSKVDFDANQFNSAVTFSLTTTKKCNAVFKYDAASGRFSFIPAKFGDTKVIAQTKTHSVYVAVENSVTFPDVKVSAWYEPFVIGAANKGLVEGYQRLFMPDANVTRAEFVQMIVSAIQLPAAKVDTREYGDVTNKNAWYYDTIMKARSAGLLVGFTDSDFKPNQFITREEMASLLAAALRQSNVPTTMQMIYLDQSFADYADMDEKYLADLELVYRVNLMVGTNGGNFDPKAVSTRAQAATVQIRLLEILGMIDTGDK